VTGRQTALSSPGKPFMSTIRSVTFTLLTLHLGSLAHGQDNVHEHPGSQVPPSEPPSPLSRGAASPGPIGADAPGLFWSRRNVFELDGLAAAEAAAADAEAEALLSESPGRPVRSGIVRALGSLRAPLGAGMALQTALAGGSSVWTLAIRSPGAFGLRLHFTRFAAGAGSVIAYGHGEDGWIARGPFTGRGPGGSGDFWTASLPGDTVYIEARGHDGLDFEVPELVHFDRDPGGQPEGDGGGGGEPADCHEDAMCHALPEAARDAVAYLSLVVEGVAICCSGTLLNDLDEETYVPYLLTALHCLGPDPQQVASTMEAVFFYQRAGCNGPLPGFFSLPRLAGGDLLALNGANDMGFVRLRGPPPAGLGLAGWTTATAVGAIGIHHPRGSWKRVAFVRPVGFCPLACLCGLAATFDYYDLVGGFLEPGASGSGVFTPGGHLAGQLRGACCSSGCDPDDIRCDNRDEPTFLYGEFQTTYPLIRPWLEIGGTIHVDGAYSGPEEGTPARPFRSAGAAHDLAWDGARIKIASGSYAERLTLSKHLILLAEAGTVTIGN
jgi:hypothetical protein